MFLRLFLVLFKSVGRLGWVWDEMLGVKGWGWGQKGGGASIAREEKKNIRLRGHSFSSPGT